MSELPYEPHEETINDARNRKNNGFTTDEIVAHAIAKEILLGRLQRLASTHPTVSAVESDHYIAPKPPAVRNDFVAPNCEQFTAPARFPVAE